MAPATSPTLDPADAVAQALARADARPAPTIKRVRYSHDAMIDLVIENPSISQNEIAEMFGYTVGWVSIVFNSDAFQARLTERKAEIIDPVLRVSVRERMGALAERSLTVLQEKLAKRPEEIPDNLALKAAELAIKGLGEGGFAPPAPSTDHLENLAARLLALGGRPPAPSLPLLETIDVEVKTTVCGDAEEPCPAGPSHTASPSSARSSAYAHVRDPVPASGPDRHVRQESGRQDPPAPVIPRPAPTPR